MKLLKCNVAILLMCNVVILQWAFSIYQWCLGFLFLCKHEHDGIIQLVHTAEDVFKTVGASQSLPTPPHEIWASIENLSFLEESSKIDPCWRIPPKTVRFGVFLQKRSVLEDSSKNGPYWRRFLQKRSVLEEDLRFNFFLEESRQYLNQD